MTALQSFLGAHRRIGLDTNVLIYYIEENPKYSDLLRPVFTWIVRPGHTAVLSTLIMTELLVPTYAKYEFDLADDLYGLLTKHPGFEWIPADLEICDLAAS